ncbi:MAG: rhomboid family intramembrane serine protease [Thermoproteota archaeon]
MFPLGDENPSHTWPIVTYLLLFSNIAIFLWEIFSPLPTDYIFYVYGFIPKRLDKMILENSINMYVIFTLFSSMFLHADLLHIIGNMVYLWTFGDNVEDVCGHIGFLVFYLISGLGGGIAHYLSDPASTIPSIGASGAISGILGAYLILYPFARIRIAVIGYFGFLRIIRVQALYMIGFWFLLQIFYVAIADISGVAYWAHIGGFIVGLVTVKFFC